MTFTHQSVELTTASRSRFLTLLSLLVALGPCTVDLYVPALPALRSDLDASTAAVQLTLTATTLGIAVGQLVAGPWSDAVGRRRPLLLATALHVAASVGVAVAPGIDVMLACRFAQGVGAAGSGVVAAAIVRDLFSGIGFVRATARLAAVTGLAPVVAPFLGSLVLNFVAWRGLFIVVAAYGLVALALSVLLLPETHPHARMRGDGAPGATNRYRAVLADRRFIGAALVSGMIVSAVFTYMTSSSFLFQEHYGLGPQAYSVVFAVNAVGFVFGSQASSRLLRRFQPTQVLARTLPALTGLGLGIAVTTLVSGSPYPLTVLTAAFFIFAGASGPCVGVIAMTPHALRAGTAAALLGAVSFGLAGITAPLAGILGGDSAMPTGLVMALTMALAVVAFRTLVLPDHTGGLRWRIPHGARTRGILSSWWQAGNDFREDLQPGSTHRDEVLETMRRS